MSFFSFPPSIEQNTCWPAYIEQIAGCRGTPLPLVRGGLRWGAWGINVPHQLEICCN